MISKNKLRAKILECGLNVEQVSKQIGIDRGTFYRKMSKNSFSIKEVDALAHALSLDAKEATDIFFANLGA